MRWTLTNSCHPTGSDHDSSCPSNAPGMESGEPGLGNTQGLISGADADGVKETRGQAAMYN